MARAADVDRERIIMTNLAACRVEEWQSYRYGDIQPGMNFVYFKRDLTPAIIAGSPSYSISFSSITIPVTAIQKIYRAASGIGSVAEPGYSLAIDPAQFRGGRTGIQAMGGTAMWFAGPVSGGTTPGVIVATITCNVSGSGGMLRLDLRDFGNPGPPVYGGRRSERISLNGFSEAICQGVQDPPVNTDFNAGMIFTKNFTQAEMATGTIVLEIEQMSWVDNKVFPAIAYPVAYDAAADSPNPDIVLTSIEFSIIEGFTENDAFSPYQIRSELISTYGEENITGLSPAWKVFVTVSKPDKYYKYKSIEMATTIVK
ncbi:MAG: hypothetical protein ABII74_01070 [Elusimicrobiota bacterium]